MDPEYNRCFNMLKNRETAFPDRFQAAVGVLHRIDKHKESALAAVKDLEGYIAIIRESSDQGELSDKLYEVLQKLSTMKDQRENFSKAGFPEFCASLWKEEKLRVRSAFMVMSLLQESGMVKEIIDIGMVDHLIKYSDWVDHPSQKPYQMLRARRFIFESLKVISKDGNNINLLVEKDLVGKIKMNCFGLTHAAEAIKQHVPGEMVESIRRDEIMLHSIGLEIMFNICARFENYGRKNIIIRKEEVKYIYDFESELESSSINALVNSPDKPNNQAITKKIMQDIVSANMLVDIVSASYQASLEIAVQGLKILYRLCSVLHLFVKEEERLKIINQIVDVASKLSGQRRHNCFSCLIVLSRHVENCPAFVATPLFSHLFFLGMEESGEVLNQLVKVLRNLSLHNSTALEQALFSNIPKLLTKILYQDLKNEIQISGVQGEEQNGKETTASLALMTIYQLALKFAEVRRAMIRAGTAPVLMKIINAHPSDITGMHAMMALGCLAATEENWTNMLPPINKELAKMLLDALDFSLQEDFYQGFRYSPLEISICLKQISSQGKNARILAAGLPLYIKVLHIFVKDYGVNPDAIVSTRTVGNIAAILQNLTKEKTVLARMVELGPKFGQLLEDAQAMASEVEEEECCVDNESSTTLQYLHLALEDELGLMKARQDVGDRIRLSSRIDVGKILRDEASFKVFMDKKRLSEFV